MGKGQKSELVPQAESSPIVQQTTVNLPQLPLPTFSDDPKLWREFWSEFEAAVHNQRISDIQKLNYLLSCLEGEAF